MTWPNMEAAVELLREKLGYFDYEDPASEEAVVEWLPELVDAALDGKALYEEPDRCLHRTLMYVHGADICADCGAAQRWVVQVWPTNSDSTGSRLAEGKES